MTEADRLARETGEPGTVRRMLLWNAMFLAVMAITWVAGRIYRVGILAYGKKPGLKELVRWVRG